MLEESEGETNGEEGAEQSQRMEDVGNHHQNEEITVSYIDNQISTRLMAPTTLRSHNSRVKANRKDNSGRSDEEEDLETEKNIICYLRRQNPAQVVASSLTIQDGTLF